MIENQLTNLSENKQETTREYARYLSDVATIEGGGARLVNSFKNEEGFYENIDLINLKLINVLPENYNYWKEKKNKELKEKYKSIDNENEKDNIKLKFLKLISGKEKKWSKATELLVDYIKEKLFIYTTKDDKQSEMWIYKQGIYIPQGRTEVKIILRDLLGDWYSNYIINLVLAKLEPDTFIDFNDFFKNNYITEIPVENGILDIFTEKIYPFNPSKIFFNKLPVFYNPNAECPKIESFLNEILPCEEDKKVFYEIGGFCLINEYTFEKAFMFVGDGRNGKDKSLELIKRLLGAENCCSIPLNILHPNSFSISELFGKKANLAGEINNQDLKDTTMFKALTGRSQITANRKNLRYLTFVNYAKQIFACNELPMVYDTSKGFWDRWVLIEFPHTFVTKEEFDKSENKDNLKIRDENIINKISTPEELSGLLNKFLEGLKRLFEQKRFSITKGTEEIKSLWIKKSNSFMAFCLDNIEESYEGRINKKHLRKHYSKYCKEHKIKPKSDMVIKLVLQNEYGVSENQIRINDELREYVWEGITWKK